MFFSIFAMIEETRWHAFEVSLSQIVCDLEKFSLNKPFEIHSEALLIPHVRVKEDNVFNYKRKLTTESVVTNLANKYNSHVRGLESTTKIQPGQTI